MESFGIVVRGLHLAAGVLLTGAFACLVLVLRPAARAGGPETPDLRALDRTLVRLGGAALAIVLLTGLLDLWRQVAVATGAGLVASLTPDRVLAVLLDTRYGAVWLGRMVLLGLLAVFLLLADAAATGRDWLALRLEGLALAAGSLLLAALAGHAASAAAGPVAVAVDALHLLATGLWAGALVPLALCLRWAQSLPEPEPALAVLTARFSQLGVVAVGVLAASGLFTAWQQVGGVPALLGTAYGHWLLAKLALFVVLLAVASRNLLVWRRLVDKPARARQAAARIHRNVLVECGLAVAILGVVAVLGLTTPGRHDEIAWPLAFRFDWDATKTLPGVQPRVAIGSQLATLGLVAALLAAVVRPRRWRIASAAGGVAIALGGAIALPPLAVDAHPTTYVRPAVPYAAASIVQGEALYRTHCQTCHGPGGYGDGPAAAGLPRPPADLTAKHAADHTAGDLFWWVTHGIPGAGMPAFGDRLAPEERWDVINFARVLGASEAARDLGPVATARPAVAAPDFAFTTGIGEDRSLRDWRGRGPVLLVFFTLPDSTERLVLLNGLATTLRLGGGEIIGVPTREPESVYRALANQPVYFPLAVDGAAEALEAYRWFRRDFSAEGQRPVPPAPAHMELLVDRQGYLRARWIPQDVTRDQAGWADPARLAAEIERLVREPAVAPVVAEHVH